MLLDSRSPRPVLGLDLHRKGAPIVIAAVGVVLLYLATRVAFAARFPYFIDEGTYASFTYRATQSWSDIWVSLTIGREPLQIWFGIPWVELGFNPLTSMRIVSVLSGLLTLPVIFLLGRRLADDWVGVVAAALFAILPFFVVHNGIGIMESLVVLVVAAALLIQIDLARRPSLRLGLLLGLVLAAGVLTKENTKPAIALIPLSLLCFDWAPAGRRRRLTLWLQSIGIVAVMVFLADRLMRLSSYYDQFEQWRENGFYTTRKLDDVIHHPFASWGTAWDAYDPAFLHYVTIPLIAACAAGAVLAFRRAPRLTAVLVGWIAVLLFVSLTFAALPYPRHVMYLIPPALVLMAYAAVEGVRWLRRRLPDPQAIAVAGVVALVALAPALVLDGRVLFSPDNGPYPGRDQQQYVELGGVPWPPVEDAIRSRARGERVVILSLVAIPDTLKMLLGPDDHYVFVGGDSPLAPRAQFAIDDESSPFGSFEAKAIVQRERFTQVGRFNRPDGNKGVILFQRPG